MAEGRAADHDGWREAIVALAAELFLGGLPAALAG
jgi:hypothetical protein